MSVINENNIPYFKIDTFENWCDVNPLVGLGVIAFEKGTSKFKVGDGIHKYKELEYQMLHSSIGYVNFTPEFHNTIHQVMYLSQTGGYIRNGEIIQVYFSIKGRIIPDRNPHGTIIAINLNDLPCFDEVNMLSIDIGKFDVLGFDAIRDVSARLVYQTNTLRFKALCTDNESGEEFKDLTVDDIADINGEIVITGYFSYINPTLIKRESFSMNLPSVITSDKTKSVMYYAKLEDSYWLQIYAILNVSDLSKLNSNDITITLPNTFPLAICDIDNYIGGIVHTSGIWNVDSKVCIPRNTRQIKLFTKSYNGYQSIVPSKYSDITQENIMISITVLYPIK